MTKHPKQACCKEKPNELRSIDSKVFELTDMPVCFGTRLCGYRNRGWIYVTTSSFCILIALLFWSSIEFPKYKYAALRIRYRYSCALQNLCYANSRRPSHPMVLHIPILVPLFHQSLVNQQAPLQQNQKAGFHPDGNDSLNYDNL